MFRATRRLGGGLAAFGIVWLAVWLLAACDSSGGDSRSDGDAAASDGDTELDNETEPVADGDEEVEIDEEEEVNTFPPESQTPLFERGLILPPDSLPCTPVSTGAPQNECNHHGSVVAELPDGAVAALWYHGEFEKSLDSRLVWSRLAPGASEWTWPELVYDDPDLSEGNATLWVHEDETLFVFFVTIFGGGWDEARVRLLRSHDGGETWEGPVMLREDYCWNIRHRPLRLVNGELLLPLYNECLALPVFMRSADDFETWTEEGHGSGQYLLDHGGQIQPALIHLTDGGVAAITRDGTSFRRIRRMTSHDQGATWTPSELTGLPNSGTSVDWVRLLDGRVVVVFNNDPDQRFPLSVALSRDEGRTFIALRDLNADCEFEGGCSWAYPSIMQSRKDGTIWVTYTHDRKTIGWVHFNEAWLAQGGGTSNISCSPSAACKDGGCWATCENDDGCEAGQVCRDRACRTPCADAATCASDQRCGENGFCAPKVEGERIDVLCLEE
ncbi:MAG: hypothetical protein C4523_00565 [Myxococcales bacterium]|nr:MAG: hypothetical protein C4523_00565 [Myxococcales bacterium]